MWSWSICCGTWTSSLVCVLEGTCRHTVAEQTAALAPGDITIVPPGLAHHLRAAPDCVCLTIKVRTSTFDQAFSALLQEQSLLSVYFTQNLYAPQSRTALTFHCGPDAFISEHLLYMYRQQQERRAYCGSIIEGLMSVLFSHLLQNHQESLEFSRGMTQFDRRMGEVIGYLGSHYPTATRDGPVVLHEPQLSQRQPAPGHRADLLRAGADLPPAPGRRAAGPQQAQAGGDL